MIAVGQKVPSVTIKVATPEGSKDFDPAVEFAGKKVIMFSLPGAFTPTCSSKHLPGYVLAYNDLKAKGIDLVVCLSVNDAFVMKAWAEAQDAFGKVVMLADGNAAFSKALGIDMEMGPMGVRAKRGVMMFDDGVAKSVEIEAPGKFEVSGADACLVALK